MENLKFLFIALLGLLVLLSSCSDDDGDIVPSPNFGQIRPLVLSPTGEYEVHSEIGFELPILGSVNYENILWYWSAENQVEGMSMVSNEKFPRFVFGQTGRFWISAEVEVDGRLYQITPIYIDIVPQMETYDGSMAFWSQDPNGPFHIQVHIGGSLVETTIGGYFHSGEIPSCGDYRLARINNVPAGDYTVYYSRGNSSAWYEKHVTVNNSCKRVKIP